MPVAIKFATDKFPDIKEFPWTEKSWDGVDVAIPIFPPPLTVKISVPELS